jgi:hypothetical protein
MILKLEQVIYDMETSTPLIPRQRGTLKENDY